MSNALLGALTTMPVLCFGVFGPVAPLLARARVERALALVFLGLAAGLALRFVPHGFSLILSTLIAGAAIGVAGILLPVVIHRRFPRQLGIMTGLYTMVLSVGGASGASLTPVLEKVSGSWTLALSSWSLPAIAAAVLWSMLATVDSKTTSGTRHLHISLLLRDRLAWYVTAFMGLQAGLAFIVLGWLPTLLRDRGLDIMDAGFVTSGLYCRKLRQRFWFPHSRPATCRRACSACLSCLQHVLAFWAFSMLLSTRDSHGL